MLSMEVVFSHVPMYRNAENAQETIEHARGCFSRCSLMQVNALRSRNNLTPAFTSDYWHIKRFGQSLNIPKLSVNSVAIVTTMHA
jgi:hypothetical protein